MARAASIGEPAVVVASQTCIRVMLRYSDGTCQRSANTRSNRIINCISIIHILISRQLVARQVRFLTSCSNRNGHRTARAREQVLLLEEQGDGRSARSTEEMGRS